MSLKFTNTTVTAEIKIDDLQVVSMYSTSQSDNNKTINISIVNDGLFENNKKECVDSIHDYVNQEFEGD